VLRVDLSFVVTVREIESTKMKSKTFVLIVLVLLAGCSLFGSPTATVKAYLTAAQKGDVDAMTQLFSERAIQKQSLDKIRSANKSFAELAMRASVASGKFHMEDVNEVATPEGKRVSFFYKSDQGADSIKFVFDLSKEGRTWKIDNIGGGESAEITNSGVPSATMPMLVETPPPASSPGEKTEAKGETGNTIAGGVLNDKAISLPKPSYPPVAKAAKASGAVIVKVLVDENGNVVSADAISGHPLLRAAAVAAARNAKFSPTKVGGEPVKVIGVINYVFSPE
jgi:TonB family protein